MRCRTETLAVVRDFTIFTGMSKCSETFFTVFIYKFFIFPNFGRTFGVPEVWLMFRLLQTVLFKIDSVLMHCLLVLMKLLISINGLSHGKVILQ